MFINRMLKVIESNNEKHSRLRVLFIFQYVMEGEKGFEGIRNESGGDAYIDALSCFWHIV